MITRIILGSGISTNITKNYILNDIS